MRAISMSSVLLLGLPFAAHAEVPFFNATCGGGIEVHADQGGPVYINGKQTKLTKVGDGYRAALGHDSIDFFTNPDGSITASWTGKNGAYGICTVGSASAAAAEQPLVPFFNATCGGGIEVHADEEGPVFINGKQAKLVMVGDGFEARLGHNSIDFFTNPDGSITASWTGKNGANGICTVDD